MIGEKTCMQGPMDTTHDDAFVLLFRGKPGVGKTLFSDALSRYMGWPVLRKDDIYDALSVEIQSHARKSQLSYRVIQAQILTQLGNGRGVIVDSSLHDPTHLQTFLGWCQRHQVPVKTLLITCSDHVLWAERFNQRGANPKPNQLITHFSQLKRHYGDLDTEPLEGEWVIDSAEAFEVNLAKMKAWLRTFIVA